MIENISTPLVSIAGSGVAGFFMGMFQKFLVIIIGSFLGAVFLVIQWMQARQYIEGQVDWNGVGNDTMAVVLPQEIKSNTSSTQSTISSSNPLSLRTIFKQLQNSVVQITSKPPNPQSANTSTSGSGFVYVISSC
jgi:S1-C subfamily serine protease